VKLREWLGWLFSDYRRVLVGAGGVLAFVLGLFGYTDWFTAQHLHDPANVAAPGPFDVLFNSFALFILGAAQGTGMPIILEIARLLAPLVVGSAAVIAFYSFSRDRLQLMRIPLWRGHVVVCGLGQVGSEILQRLCDEVPDPRHHVVVIESVRTNPNVELCRDLKIPVIFGDAQRKETLRSAGVPNAARVIAVGPSDAVNAEIVAIAQGLAKSRTAGALHCLARIDDPELCALLRIQEASFTLNPTSSTLEFFNLDDVGARAWLTKFPIPRSGRPHILVSRLDGLGTWLVLLAAARWCANRTDDTKLWITVVDDRAEERVGALVAQYPGVGGVCHFVYSSTSVPDVRGLAAKLKGQMAPPLILAYVTADTDERALEAALGLRHHFNAALPDVVETSATPGRSATLPLVVEMWQTSGVGRLISETHAGGGTDVRMFPSLEAACTPELIKGGSFDVYEPIAIAIHERWCEQQPHGKPRPTWQELDESRKESSRAQARDIEPKLTKIRCHIEPSGASNEPEFHFDHDEIEMLARDEHERWIRERIEDGWQPVEKEEDKDTDAKKTPYLIPFDRLSDEVADFDRDAVRGIPEVLKATGKRVVRDTAPEHVDQPSSHL
jgi:voltage-gated potassium channel Kch